jgi:predicted 3-demethylubiquinone-9 3-methyltransferase (glyoxalase superfamily)
MPRISPFLWFDGQARAAAEFYVSIFPNSKILGIHRYGEAGQEQHGQTPVSVMPVEFELDGHRFPVLNGGPHSQFTPAVSFVVNCKTRAEVNLYG